MGGTAEDELEVHDGCDYLPSRERMEIPKRHLGLGDLNPGDKTEASGVTEWRDS